MKLANILLNGLWNLCHQNFIIFSSLFIGKAYSIDNCEMANVLTCLATY